jgi:serine/threonine-protein kinase HipA
MNSPTALAIALHARRIGVLAKLAGDRYLFTFDDAYVANRQRATLSLSFKSTTGDLLTTVRASKMQLPPFFANLLPEGSLRDYLARQAGVKPTREFTLLSLLGADLPGAVTAQSLDETWESTPMVQAPMSSYEQHPTLLKFSLAGVQLKFSALADSAGHLTIPAHGMGGSWIVKLPSPRFPALTENEFVMMELARRSGIEVPDIRLLPVSGIAGLPADINHLQGQALAVQRFDRSSDGGRLHMEDFAQVFGVYPANKYEQYSYANIAAVLSCETSDADVREFMRRLVFSVLIGNGDMHLKNWSLLYPDGRTPVLSPAYDLVATVPYLPNDQLALTFGKERALNHITRTQVRRLAEKARLAVSPLWEIVQETTARVVEAWRDHPPKELLPADIRDVIDRQINQVARNLG